MWGCFRPAFYYVLEVKKQRQYTYYSYIKIWEEWGGKIVQCSVPLPPHLSLDPKAGTWASRGKGIGGDWEGWAAGGDEGSPSLLMRSGCEVGRKQSSGPSAFLFGLLCWPWLADKHQFCNPWKAKQPTASICKGFCSLCLIKWVPLGGPIEATNWLTHPPITYI